MNDFILCFCKVSVQISSQMTEQVIYANQEEQFNLRNSLMQQQIHVQLQNIQKKLNQFHSLFLIENDFTVKYNIYFCQSLLQSVIKSFNILFKLEIQFLTMKQNM